MPNGGTVDFEVTHMGLYDDTYMTAYRNPVSTVQSTTSTSNILQAPILVKKELK